MNYTDFRRQVWTLWGRHRHSHGIDLDYRTWIEAKVVKVLTSVDDSGARELARHMAHDMRMEPHESVLFGEWIDTIRTYGFTERKEAVK